MIHAKDCGILGPGRADFSVHGFYFKVDLLKEKIEMFLKLDLFGSTAMDLHIGLGYHLIWSLDGVRELTLSDIGN